MWAVAAVGDVERTGALIGPLARSRAIPVSNFGQTATT
jgi:hypothetical protein